MTPHERRELVERIHDTPTLIVLAVAGGGNAAITDLLDVPGASRTVLEARVPYSATAMADLISGDANHTRVEPELTGAVSKENALAMAEACLRRAQQLAPDNEDLLGVACTAALVTDRPKRGEHRAHIAIASGHKTVQHTKVSFEKGVHDRPTEDRLVADAILTELAKAVGLDT